MALQKPYVSVNSWGTTYGEHKAYLEFTDEEFLELQSYATRLGLIFTASAMDSTSLHFLAKIGVPFIKIGSGDANNFILLEEAAQLSIPLVISTGMQDLEAVQHIYKLVSKYHKNFALLHCLSSYPSPYEEINLNVLNLYRTTFNDINIGYSGHELGTHITVASVAMGARVNIKYNYYNYFLLMILIIYFKIVERHITLNKNQKGSDHKCSLEPEQLSEMVRNIRTLELALGQPIKKLQKSEGDCYEKLGKTIVSRKCLNVGHKLKRSDLIIKVAQPKGIDGSQLDKIVNKCLGRSVSEDESILPEYLI